MEGQAGHLLHGSSFIRFLITFTKEELSWLYCAALSQAVPDLWKPSQWVLGQVTVLRRAQAQQETAPFAKMAGFLPLASPATGSIDNS